jgi:hypothetical protein
VVPLGIGIVGNMQGDRELTNDHRLLLGTAPVGLSIAFVAGLAAIIVMISGTRSKRTA